MKLTIFRIITGFCAVLMMVFIFINSSDDAEVSTQKSNSVTQVVAEIVVPNFNEKSEAEQQDVIDKTSPIIREIAHGVEFCCLAFFMILCLLTFFDKSKYFVPIIITVLFCILYALFDEYHQTFVGGRAGEMFDVMIDTIGNIIGTFFGTVFTILYFYIKEKSNNQVKNGSNL